MLEKIPVHFLFKKSSTKKKNRMNLSEPFDQFLAGIYCIVLSKFLIGKALFIYPILTLNIDVKKLPKWMWKEDAQAKNIFETEATLCEKFHACPSKP